MSAEFAAWAPRFAQSLVDLERSAQEAEARARAASARAGAAEQALAAERAAVHTAVAGRVPAETGAQAASALLELLHTKQAELQALRAEVAEKQAASAQDEEEQAGTAIFRAERLKCAELLDARLSEKELSTALAQREATVGELRAVGGRAKPSAVHVALFGREMFRYTFCSLCRMVMAQAQLAQALAIRWACPEQSSTFGCLLFFALGRFAPINARVFFGPTLSPEKEPEGRTEPSRPFTPRSHTLWRDESDAYGRLPEPPKWGSAACGRDAPARLASGSRYEVASRSRKELHERSRHQAGARHSMILYIGFLGGM